MPKRSSKPRDLNQLAARLVHDATSDEVEEEKDPYGGKNPSAVELGRLGGKKGGKARAAKLSPEQRSEIARAAANKRWSSQP